MAWSRSLLVLTKACSTLCLGKPMSVRACKIMCEVRCKSLARCDLHHDGTGLYHSSRWRLSLAPAASLVLVPELLQSHLPPTRL